MEMWQRLAVIIVVVAGHCGASHVVQMQGPCNFFDTINITSGHLDQHGNFHHLGTVFKKGMFAEYNYVLENLTEMVMVEPHVRGCICGIKPCIRLCCIEETNNNSACVKTDKLIVPTQFEYEEIDLSGRTFGVLIGRPCGKMYKLEPLDYPDDRWYFSVSCA